MMKQEIYETLYERYKSFTRVIFKTIGDLTIFLCNSFRRFKLHWRSNPHPPNDVNLYPDGKMDKLNREVKTRANTKRRLLEGKRKNGSIKRGFERNSLQ